MKRLAIFPLLALLSAFLLAAMPACGDQLRLRLARTSPQGEISPELQEVAEILMRNLNLGSCVLLDETTIVLPKVRQTLKLRGYWIDIVPQNEDTFLVSIFRKENRILRSTVRPSTEAPLILGGFRPGPPRRKKPGLPAKRRPPRPADGPLPAPGPHHGMLPAPAPNPAATPAPPPELPAPPVEPPQFKPGVRHILILERLAED